MLARKHGKSLARMNKDSHFARFLRQVGGLCKKLRKEKGWTTRQLALEAGGLSPSMINNLEHGRGNPSLHSLFRVAEALEIEPRALLDFSVGRRNPNRRESWEILPPDHPHVAKGAYKTLLPVYSLPAVAGPLETGRAVEPLGWLEVNAPQPLTRDLFVAQVRGHSMEPKIDDGDYVVFRHRPAGPRQGKIVLAEYRGPADPDTGGSYTVKAYSSVRVPSLPGKEFQSQVLLSPLNQDYEPIQLRPDDEGFRIVAEYVCHA